MTDALTISDMQANVERSKGHVAKQDAIIARLVEQGHEDAAAKARALLITMKEHLATELDILARMEGRSSAGLVIERSELVMTISA